MAIELAASIAAWTAGGAALGTLAWLSEMYSALSPGVSGAGVPVGAGAPEAASCSEIAARLSLSACSRDSSASSVLLALRLGFLEFGEARRGFGAGGGGFALLDRDRVARFLQLQADRRHPLDRGLRFVAQPLDPAGDRVVVVLDPAQVFGADAGLRPGLPIRARR